MKGRIKSLTLFFLLLFLPIVEAKDLTAIEKHIIRHISEQQDAQLSLLEQLVNINSGTENTAGVHQVGELLKTRLEKLGFTTHWQDIPPDIHRAGALIAERQGSKGKRLLLIGHLDTVFPSASPFQKFTRQGSYATGPGVIDDKGGDVVILFALEALEKVHALDDTTIRVVLSGDEEDAGKPTSITRQALLKAAQQSDIALDFEWSFTQDTATVARRGISSWTITTQGNETHSSAIFQKTAGDGAIFELSRILNTMRTRLSDEKYLSFNPGLILAGTQVNAPKKTEGNAFGKINVIAKTAYATGDLRFLTKEQKQKAEKKIASIVNQHLPGTSASIHFQDGIPPMPPSSANLNLLQQYSEISDSLGHGKIKSLNPGVRGAGDISYVSSLVRGNLAGLGPIGTGAHSTKEKLDIHSLPIQTQRAALLIYRLTR
ncbi:M20/M25/M40 family metallo-hydrolase [Legionella maceachernii]|uniref:Carboxypeptidase G2 n=1 Tax=Legionella maceachernii TaxID=466 RepID=A0A0W0W745_9GAMM|nr:M20/M25/M40 family metallo-hydrolase [Legionella maceachernii]KTD27987.1 carboxypeptidase G2 [Legionella maceachernii]SKA06334.1 glutamate carboxypeptidase [Legionella maceachernii]SUO99900.1 Carboxypeptidase G2 precursor [Legionella maceachernii]